MGTVVAQASMSLDGYIAHEDNGVGRLFDWYEAGDEEVPTATPGLTFRLTAASAAYWRAWTSGLGAIVCGRTLFDVTDGWGGRHTMDAPVVVVTHDVPAAWVDAHPDAPFTFVTEGVEAAVAHAQQVAGPRTVAVTAGTIAAQCLQLGLLDVVAVDLVPVVMGGGRPFFPGLVGEDVLLGEPEVCVVSTRVTHLRMPVRRAEEAGR
jgi:dihydrofolate reductase